MKENDIRARRAEAKKPSTLAPHKLKLLFTVVNREKTELYTDLLQSFSVNLQLSVFAEGTATRETLHLLGLTESEKALILSVIRADEADRILSFLEEKFRTVKNGKGIAYTVPMTSTVGVTIYRFLANLNTNEPRGV